MKKIGIISDTHSHWDARYIKYFTGCDEIWHAGDIGSEQIIDRLEKIAPVRAVYGNCDGATMRRRFKEFESFELDGVKVAMTHIGGYPGKYAPGIKRRLELLQPKIFIAGHSHILKVIPDRQLNLLHINPGAAGLQGWQVVRTLVLLTIDAATITDCKIIELVNENEL